jgi:rubrerythrin
MELSKSAIARSRAAWAFAHAELIGELARRELDRPEVVEAVWDVFVRLEEEFADAAEAETDDITEMVREEYERTENELVRNFLRYISQRRMGVTV